MFIILFTYFLIYSYKSKILAYNIKESQSGDRNFIKLLKDVDKNNIKDV